MVYHQFPDLSWLKKQVESNFANRKTFDGRTIPDKGWPTVVLNVDTQHILRDNIRGPLSIFANIAGESQVAIDGKRVNIKDDLFFVTNHDQHYTLEVGKAKASTFNIHFGEYFIEHVFDTLKKKPHLMLDDDSFYRPFEHINFHNKLYYKTDRFQKLIKEVLAAEGDQLLLEEKLFNLVELLLEDHVLLKKSSAELPVIKSATREELTRRMLLATDFIYTNLHRDISLDELAAVSCLSKFHFLRLFKVHYKKTPHQFISETKAARAKSLLKNSKLDIISISRSLGFRDASTFSRAFFNQVGVYPTQFR